MEKTFKMSKMLARLEKEGRASEVTPQIMSIMRQLDGRTGTDYNWQSVVGDEPLEKAEIVDIESTLENYQTIVGGFIEAVYPFDDLVCLVCNDEGKFYEEPNRALYDDSGKLYDIIYGTFFVCGLGEEDFIDMTEELAEKYRKRFERGEIFIRTGNEITVFHI